MPQTTYNSSGCRDAVWSLAKTIRGCDSDQFRQDPYGNKICYNSYGKSTSMGWDVDHIKPMRSGGTSAKGNLRMRSKSANRADNK